MKSMYMRTYVLPAMIILALALPATERPNVVNKPVKLEGYKGNSQELLDRGFKRYEVESGIAILDASGIETGVDTIYFDRWGLREAKYSSTTMSIMGITQTKRTIDIIDGEWQYNVNLETNTATEMKSPILSAIAKKGDEKNMTAIGRVMLEQMGAELVGTETVLGKACEVWELQTMSVKTWVWKGVTLKLSTSMMGMVQNREATSFEANVDIDQRHFAISDDVTVNNLNPVLEKMLKNK